VSDMATAQGADPEACLANRSLNVVSCKV
jgi:hypothetical protein